MERNEQDQTLTDLTRDSQAAPDNGMPTLSPNSTSEHRENQSATVDETRIQHVLQKSKEILDQRLKPATELIRDIKRAMSNGLDTISDLQVQEWAVVIPIICQELSCWQNAYNLSRDLWDIEVKKMCATNLLEFTLKKVQTAEINRIEATKGETEKAVKAYLRNTIAGTQESLYQLANALRKISDYRIMTRGQ